MGGIAKGQKYEAVDTTDMQQSLSVTQENSIKIASGTSEVNTTTEIKPEKNEIMTDTNQQILIELQKL